MRSLVPPHILATLALSVNVALDEPLFDVGVHGEPHVVHLLAGVVAEYSEELVVVEHDFLHRGITVSCSRAGSSWWARRRR